MKIYKLSKNANIQSIHLWLDDERDPSTPFIQQNFGAQGNEIWVKSTEEAKSYLNQNIVQSISFDNDLGENMPEGYDLAKYIEEKAYNQEIKPLQWKIHSANPKGKKYIEMAMTQANKFWNKNNKNNLNNLDTSKAQPLNQKSYEERYKRWNNNNP